MKPSAISFLGILKKVQPGYTILPFAIYLNLRYTERVIKERSIVDVNVDLGPLDPRDFGKVYAIMEEAFPPAETWPYEKARELINEPDYEILCVKSRREQLAGFLAIRDFPTFNFAEYFAIRKSMRGMGVGSAALKHYLNRTSKPLVLEVEACNTARAKRRIKFYQRLGFILNDLSYIQPPMHLDDPLVPLTIMSHPVPIPKNEQHKIKNQIFRRVYGRAS